MLFILEQKIKIPTKIFLFRFTGNFDLAFAEFANKPIG